MTAIDHKYAALGAPADFQRHITAFAINIAWRGLLASLASVVLGIVPAGLAWAQDGIECRPGTHCAPHPIGKPCIRCIPDAPPLPRIIVVDWQNYSGSENISGTENGTAANPYRTVSQGIAAAAPGATLSIRTGFYNAETTLLFAKAVSVRAENGPVTIYAHSTDEILTSPDEPGDQPPAGANTCNGGLYAQGGKALSVPNEWMQPAGGDNLPALGRVIDKSEPNDDISWDHPFGFDYWWSLAPDHNYLSLLNDSTLASKMDCSDAGIKQGRGSHDVCNAYERTTQEGSPFRPAEGILHTEIEDRLLPGPYRPLPGDRVYMRGHRIIDCGHNDYGAEMHPPTLVVAARLSPDDNSLRTTLFAMPYITTQRYEPDGSDFPTHVMREVSAVLFSPVGKPLEFIAQIDSKPFAVSVVARYRVTMPPIPRRTTAVNLHYHFITRPGVTVIVNPVDSFRADVEVRMDPAMYQPFSGPGCTTKTLSLEDIDARAHWPKGATRTLVFSVLPVVGVFGVPPFGLLLTLNAGMKTALCEVPNGTPRTPWISNDNAVVTDASQPFPVYGWLSYD